MEWMRTTNNVYTPQAREGDWVWNGLPRRSARRHVALLIFCFFLFSVFCRRSYIIARARHNTVTALQELIEESVTSVLPALESLLVERLNLSGPVRTPTPEDRRAVRCRASARH